MNDNNNDNDKWIMIEVRNKLIPFSGCKALTVWPLLFQRAKYMTAVDMRHEEIHGRQQREVLAVGAVLAVAMAVCGCGWWSLVAVPLYFWWYGVEYVVRLVDVLRRDIDVQRPFHEAYRAVSFEHEAYFFQGDETYLERRKPFHWLYNI